MQWVLCSQSLGTLNTIKALRARSESVSLSKAQYYRALMPLAFSRILFFIIMFASRVVCSRLSSSRRPHGGGAVAAGLVLPPRRVVRDIILPAGETLVNFAFRGESRENFINMANKGIINVEMLGIPLSLALYSGLNSPLMEKYNFNVVEFGEGAKAALQRYHDIQNALQDEICIWAKHTIDLKLSPFKIMELAEKKQAELKLEAAETDTSESLVAQMKLMVTPEYLEQMCSSMIRDTLLLKEINLNYNNWTSHVSNVSCTCMYHLHLFFQFNIKKLQKL